MDPRYDIQLAEDDLIISNQDVAWGISDVQHVEDTINCWPGWWMENFSDGVGISSYLNSDGQEQVLARAIILQLKNDLYVSSPIVKFSESGQLDVNPNVSQ